MKPLSVILFGIAIIFFFVLSPGSVCAQSSQSSDQFEARVVRILEEKLMVFEELSVQQHYQKLELLVTSGKEKGSVITLEHGNIPMASIQIYKPGDELIVSRVHTVEGVDSYYITDVVRRAPLMWLFFIFLVVVVVVGRLHGVMSLVGMGISFLVIFRYILPRILAGDDPVRVAIIGALGMVPSTFYLSHGLNKKTTVAVVGTIVALVITGGIAGIFVELVHLTGFATEEAGFIQSFFPNAVNIRGLLLAGIIISGIGVFDDVTVSQASIVEQLKHVSHSLSVVQLYKRGMAVGHDHIASVVNTLVLVYAGSALPLLVLFVGSPRPFSELVNYELVAEEIVKTLVASIGLILAVPVTTALAALMFRDSGVRKHE